MVGGNRAQKKLTLPYEEYRAICNMLVVYMKNEDLRCKYRLQSWTN